MDPLALEAVGPNPTDRGKRGTKRSLLLDTNGIPLSLIASGTRRHGVALPVPTLAHVVLRRPPPEEQRQHLCGDMEWGLVLKQLVNLA